jgi:hypothetical protein
MAQFRTLLRISSSRNTAISWVLGMLAFIATKTKTWWIVHLSVTAIHSAHRQRQRKNKILLNRQDDIIDGAPVSFSGRELVAFANAFSIKLNVTEYLDNLRDVG